MPSLSERFRTLMRQVLREHASPVRLGVAVGVGALVGSSPLIGLHAVVALGIATLARLNRVGAFVGSNVSVGPLMPLWIATEVGVGSQLLGRSVSAPSELRWDSAFTTAASAWWMGWLVVGPVLGFAAGGLTFALARKRDERTGPSAGPEASGPAEPTSSPTPRPPAPPANE